MNHDFVTSLGLRDSLNAMAPWELAALAREVLDCIEVHPRGPARNRVLVAKEAVTDVRDFYAGK